MDFPAQERLSEELASIRDSGLYKDERIIVSPQSAEITLADGRRVLNFCANNYLGLADHPRLIAELNDAGHGNGRSRCAPWYPRKLPPARG
jgi:glycine C-acetyltransferase